MDKIINKINDDIRKMQINPCDEIALIGRSIYFHFRSVVKLYDSGECVEADKIENRIVELGSEIKVISEFLNKKGE